jgi:hypothetical protein
VRRAAAAAIGCALVAAGCGARVAPAEISGLDAPASSPTTTAPAATGASTTTSLVGSAAAVGAGSHSATSTTAAPSQAAGSGPLTPTAAGTYTYNQSGPGTTLQVGSNPPSTTAPPPKGTTVYDSPSSASGGYQQVAHEYVNTQQPSSDTTYLETPSGIFITTEVERMTVAGSTTTFTCTFAQPMEISPWPVSVGYSFTGSATCSGSSGSFTLSASGKINGTQTVTLDGAAVTAYVVDTSVTTSGSVTSTDSEVDWFAPSLRLDVHSSVNEHGNFGTVATFSIQVTRDLVSGHPS